MRLRGSLDEVSGALQKELEDRVAGAGVSIEEARISHLANAPEIAGAMLQRQQAEAIVGAGTDRRWGGGHGRDGSGEARRAQDNRYGSERKAAMVSNLLVVLCGQGHAQPIVNTGTLYN